MLVLTRKAGENIWIGDNITISITHIDPGRVRVGVLAPSDLLILRGELYAKLTPEQRSEMLQSIQSRKGEN